MLRESKEEVRPVRVLEVWRQAYSGYWIAHLSNGVKIGAKGDDEIQAYWHATKWVEEYINEQDKE